uniref:Synergin gamma C-terminal domain-containing protein n=1 Tax=Aegilops tauschii subsp. strangulata TaxID=200361 RepID=A0A453KA71_AEGTS
WDSCINAWTSGLETALKTVVDSNHLAAPAGKALLESIISINELEVANFQHCLANNELTCRLTLLPTGLLQVQEGKWLCGTVITILLKLPIFGQIGYLPTLLGFHSFISLQWTVQAIAACLVE